MHTVSLLSIVLRLIHQVIVGFIRSICFPSAQLANVRQELDHSLILLLQLEEAKAELLALEVDEGGFCRLAADLVLLVTAAIL